MSHNESKVDVLVIGAGPAGLMCANGLARFGVDVKIIDKRVNGLTAGQADGIQPRTIEVLQSYGLADRLLREGNQIHIVAFYNPGPDGGLERTGRALDVAAPTARYPFEVTLHQGAIESILADSMRGYGTEVDRCLVPTNIEISEDPIELSDRESYPVKVVLKNIADESTQTIFAKYVIGADGAHSWVRKALGIEMEGEQTEYIWGVVDSAFKTDFPDIRNKSAIHSNNGSAMIIPRERDKVRLYLQLKDHDVVCNGRVNMAKMDAQRLISIAKKSLAPYSIEPGDIEWWTLYIIGQRVASSYQRKERVFIVGDACHTHSPKAGQGMNAGMNDAHNLIWKLTQVLQGRSKPSILSTYEYERRKYAQDLIDFDRKFSSLFSEKPRSKDSTDGVSHDEFLQAFQTYGGFSSGIGIHYAPSAITNTEYQASAKNLIIGQRVMPQTLLRAADGRAFELQDLLPSDMRFKILVFVGDVNNELQYAIIRRLGDELERVLQKYAGGSKPDDIFDVLSISTTSIENIEYTRLPPVMRRHWSKVLLDQKEIQCPRGTAYPTYGICHKGAIVVVRPDGYVGTVAPLHKAEHLDQYFAGFLCCAE